MSKILLISHEELLMKAYKLRLKREGFEVEICCNAKDGLLKARQWLPDLIVVELALPGIHGLDVVKWLRDVPWLVKVPAIVLIDQTVSEKTVESCLFWGAYSCVYKDSSSLDEFISNVRSGLDMNSLINCQ